LYELRRDFRDFGRSFGVLWARRDDGFGVMEWLNLPFWG
jgi:hypothetical protein